MSNNKFTFDVTRIENKVATFALESVSDFEDAYNKALTAAADHDFSQHSSNDVDYVAELVSAPEGSKVVTRAEKYLAQGGNNCPSCGGDDFECGNLESDGLGAWRTVACNGCGASWEDAYQMTGVSTPSGFDPDEYVDPAE